MLRFLIITLCIWCLIPSAAAQETEQDYTCDGSDDDALVAAQEAQNAGNLENAIELAHIAEDICRMQNPQRYAEAFSLRMQLQQNHPDNNASDQTQAFNTLFSQAQNHINQANYSTALELLQQALEITQAHDMTPQSIIVHNEIGKMYRVLGQFDEASTAHELAAQLAESSGNTEQRLQSLLNIGYVYEETAEFETAIARYREIIEQADDFARIEVEALSALIGILVRQSRFDEVNLYLDTALEKAREYYIATNSPGILMSILTYAGAFYAGSSQLDLALQHYEEALILAQAMNDHLRQAEIASFIGNMYTLRTEYDTAEEYQLIALEIVENLEPSRLREYTRLNIIRNLSVIYSATGRSPESLNLLEGALESAQEIGDPRTIGGFLLAIGNLHAQFAQYTQALTYFEDAYEVFDTYNLGEGRVLAIGNSAYVYNNLGQSATAIARAREAIRIAEPLNLHDHTITFLMTIGNVYQNQARYSEALAEFNRALDIATQHNVMRSQDNLLNNIGSIYRLRGEFELAIESYQESIEMSHQTEDLNNEGVALANLSYVLMLQGEFADAEDYINQGLEITRSINDVATEINLLRNRAILQYVTGNVPDGLATIDSALELAEDIQLLREIEILRSQRGFILENSGRFEEALTEYERAIVVREQLTSFAGADSSVSAQLGNTGAAIDVSNYHRAAMIHINGGDLTAALNSVERGRSVLLRTALVNGDINYDEQSDEFLLSEEERLRAIRDNAQNTLSDLLNNEFAQREAIEQATLALEEAREAYDSHQELMQIEGGYLARQIAFDTVEVSEIQASLPDDATLIIYSVGLFDGLAIIVEQDNIQAIKLGVTLQELNEMVGNFSTQRDTANAIMSLQQLSDRLINPIADLISPTTEHLIVSGDGILTYIPFAALPVNNAYLIDMYRISTVPSGSIFALLAQEDSIAQDQTPITAGAILAQNNAPGFRALNNIYQEAQDIAASLGVEAITEATEADFRLYSGSADVLYVGGHYELEPTAPMYSAIHLAGGESHDGRLEVNEIYGLDFHSTDLVILSGCETGIDGVGQDFSLLTQSFLAGGAKSVVGSLWSVDDERTAMLLTTFVEARSSGLDNASALQHAMISLRDAEDSAGNKPNASPYYWAAFTLVGYSEPRPSS